MFKVLLSQVKPGQKFWFHEKTGGQRAAIKIEYILPSKHLDVFVFEDEFKILEYPKSCEVWVDEILVPGWKLIKWEDVKLGQVFRINHHDAENKYRIKMEVELQPGYRYADKPNASYIYKNYYDNKQVWVKLEDLIPF